MLYDENNKVIMKSVNSLVGEPNLVCVKRWEVCQLYGLGQASFWSRICHQQSVCVRVCVCICEKMVITEVKACVQPGGA